MKHIQFLSNLGQLQFSGQLVCSDQSGQTWTVYLSQGAIIHATGGLHRVRRWRRVLTTYCRYIPTYRLAWQISLAHADADMLSLGWEYALLQVWLKQQKITPEQSVNMIRTIVSEVLFDMMQVKDIATHINPTDAIATSLASFSIEEMIRQSQRRWMAWEEARLQKYSPNQAPLIKQADKFQQQSSAQFYQKLVKLLNGQHSLYDLAVEMQHDVIEMAASMHLYIEVNWIELVDIPDLPAPIYRQQTATPASSPPQAIATPAQLKVKVACVDDSPLVRHMMQELLTSAGYEFVGIEDALRAVGILLSHKPDVIFLDLMMPNVNGYELCEQLRKISCFRHTPIVILTSNDGFANRLRSKIVNASDFLSKPLNAEAVLSVIRKHLEQGAALSMTTHQSPEQRESI